MSDFNELMDGLYDINHDGELDGFERNVQLDDFLSTFESDNDGDDIDDEMQEHLDAMEFMDEEEREEYMEDNDLDPDDFDF